MNANQISPLVVASALLMNAGFCFAADAMSDAPAATSSALPPPPPPPPYSIPLVVPVPQFPPAPLSEAEVATIAESKRKALSGEDTVTTRLQALAAELDAVISALKQVPPDSTKYFAKTMGDLTLTQTYVARGLDYVKAHPGENSLASRVREVKYYGASAGGWASTNLDIVIRESNSIPGGPNLATVEKLLTGGFDEFIGLPQQGRPLLGEIGGNRDLIMRAGVVADMELLANTLDLLGLRPPPGSAPGAEKRMYASLESSANVTLAALAKGLGDPDHTGSIAGTAVPPNPAVFVNALICITALDSSDPPRGLAQTSVLATYADDNGNFVIKNLPPGVYAVTAVGGSMTESVNRVVVEVKEGAETKLLELLKYKLFTGGNQGGPGG
jgi:hypothetical protein